MSLVVADELLVPLQTEFFALEGISQLVRTIDRIKIKETKDENDFLTCSTEVVKDKIDSKMCF